MRLTGEGMPGAMTQIIAMAMRYESAQQATRDFWAQPQCTDEMIAEQRAALEGQTSLRLMDVVGAICRIA